ncbi:HIT family protein [Rhizobium sp. S95]|uniref:HIT family protein n=2 Tax=Rhizobiaceae TaxID=82115 RepID=A0AAJ1BUP5_9HYPH|nr:MULTISPECIES: HIT family protein [unclassified Ciceribacter]MCM2395063.1 HIT family protein [Ciceribacter sp. S95]MCO5955485.1 HIT family protein [Ciceribacter sp. S101]
MLIDKPIGRLTNFYLLGSIEPDRPAQSLVVPFRHMATLFELNSAEWAELGNALQVAKSFLDPFRPSGWTIGWNVGAIAGQEVFHAHLHVVARFAEEPTAGRGIHALFRTP